MWPEKVFIRQRIAGKGPRNAVWMCFHDWLHWQCLVFASVAKGARGHPDALRDRSEAISRGYFLALVFLDDESAVSDFLDLSDAESLDSL